VYSHWEVGGRRGVFRKMLAAAAAAAALLK
jgi:hypothetical protein